MVTTKLYLDTRGAKDVAPLKLSLSKNGKTALISLGIKLQAANWDAKLGKVVGGANKASLNAYITEQKQRIDMLILRMSSEGRIANVPVSRIKKIIMSELNPESKSAELFLSRFLRFAEKKKGRTKEIYLATYNRMKAFDDKLAYLSFEDITKEWLMSFDVFLAETSPSRNARNIHLRNIRAVFNDAIDDEITSAYPFRKFKIRPQKTAKRSLTVEQLRELFAIEPDDSQQQYLDMFKLIFLLVGINIADLCKLGGIKGGRIEYYRAKTGRFYSIKVEPEAECIINKYKGKKRLLDIMDRYANYRDYAKRLNENLKHIGHTEIGKHGKKIYRPLFPDLTTYWARHSWATMAASLDIPKETIAAALGHGGNTVTDIYIDFDMRKVDEANRRVIDYVLYNMK